ncbi:unnamed protein product [Amoebophrya sp. A120]|nr:unnamed protein product [Amoebophrya sp. A120]|eukprot:GSA120T00002341001.1
MRVCSNVLGGPRNIGATAAVQRQSLEPRRAPCIGNRLDGPARAPLHAQRRGLRFQRARAQNGQPVGPPASLGCRRRRSGTRARKTRKAIRMGVG